VFSKLSLEIPDDWNIYYTGLRTKEIEFTKTREKITWQCKNLEYEPEEILTLPDEFLQKKILFTCYNQEKVENQDFSSWKNVSEWCYRVFQESAGKNENLISAANDLIKNCRNNEEKINTIARFVQNEIRYVAIEIGKNRWVPRPAITTFENRYGDCKDKTMLMIEMLSSIGIESYPVFVGSAKPVFDELPSPYQFNHCVVGIPVNQMNNISYLENSVYNGYLIFDPTDYQVKLGELPLALHNSGALIATPDNPGLFYLEKTSPEEYLEVIEADASIDAVGTLAVKIKIQFFKAIAYSMLYELKQLSFEEQREFFYAMLKDEIPNPQIDYIDLQNNKDTLTAYLNISAHNYAQVESIFYLKAQLIDLETFPELKPKERHFPIWLGAPRKTRITTKWKFPEGYKPVSASDSLTANIECASAFYYSTIYKNGANTVVEVQYTGMPMPPERYSDAILFNQRLNKFNSQLIVLNRGVK
jgi:hypothetical protein